MKKKETGQAEKYTEAKKTGKKFPGRKAIQIFMVAAAMTFGGGTAVVMQNVFDGREPAEEYIAEKKEYTMLLYVIGSDLEYDPDGGWGEEQSGAASNDMEEIAVAMKEFGLDDSVHVVAQIGGSESWKQESLADIRNARLIIDSEGIHVTEELPDTDMGESETLAEFVDYACKTYPAEHYIVVFWNHGSGPARGYGNDILHDESSLTLDELKQAFALSQYQEFDLIGFDACYMGNIETVNALCAYTEYMVGSPACEAIDGWDYSWLEILREKEEPDEKIGKKIGKKIVDAYAAFYQDPEHENKVATLSCYDMEAYEKLQEGIQEYTHVLLAKSEEEEDFFENLSGKRNQIAGYDTGGICDVMCLLDFQQLFACLDAEQWEVCEMQEALKDFVCYATGISKEMSGISIYLPGKKGLDLAEEIFLYLNCRFDESYLKFVYKYAALLDDNLEINLEGVRIKYSEKTKKIQFQIPRELMEEIAAAYIMTAFQTEEGEYYLLSTDSDVTIDEKGMLTGILDKKYFAIADQLLCLIEQYHSEESTVYTSPVLYKDKICMMTVEVSFEAPDGRIVSIVPYDGLNSGKEQYALEEGEDFCALYPVIPKDGGTVLNENMAEDNFHEGEPVMLKEEDCALQLLDVDFKQCSYGLMIKDKALGIQYSDLRKL